jgi:hypothetical protein
MDRGELFVVLGTVAVWVAATLTIVDRFLSLSERFKTFIKDRRSKSSIQGDPHTAADTEEQNGDEAGEDPVSELLPKLPAGLAPALSYLFRREVLIIGGAGLLLNYLGLALSARSQSILFLDMTGTALTAFLLGPWWGAIVALLSSSAINWLLSPIPGAELNIFPWGLVNMTGGLFWGWMARTSVFRQYLQSGSSSVMAHSGFLFRFGFIGAMVMSVPGTLVQAAVAPQAPMPLNPEVTASLQQIVSTWEQAAREFLEPKLGLVWGESVGWAVVNWLETLLRYIPDKTMSVAIALVVLKYGFPLFEQELIHGLAGAGSSATKRSLDNRLTPLLFGLVYAPSFGMLVSSGLYGGPPFWGLWLLPWLLVLGGYMRLQEREPSDAQIRQFRAARAKRYSKALKPLARRASYHFCQRLTLITLLASMLFVLILPLVLDDYQKVTINFFGVVYGSLLAIYLVRIAISQNVSVLNHVGTPDRGRPAERGDGAERSESRSGRVFETRPAARG